MTTAFCCSSKCTVDKDERNWMHYIQRYGILR